VFWVAELLVLLLANRLLASAVPLQQSLSELRVVNQEPQRALKAQEALQPQKEVHPTRIQDQQVHKYDQH
jgi:hypothetical protein